MPDRECSKIGCRRPAVATFTYDYDSELLVIGPLSSAAQPGGHDLCAFHAGRLTAPRGWQVIRHVSVPAAD